MTVLHKIALLLVASQFLYGIGFSYVLLDMWERGCKGGWYRNDRIENSHSCYSWPSAGGSNRGVQMNSGTCLEIFTSTGCSNHNGYLTDLHRCLSRHIYSARVCRSTTTNIRCPPGQLVKAMEVSGNGTIGGLSIQCYSQETATSSLPSGIYNLNDAAVDNPLRTTCSNGIGALINQMDDVRGVVDSTTPSCDVFQCLDGEVVVGITVSVEDYTALVKNISVICAPMDQPVIGTLLV